MCVTTFQVHAFFDFRALVDVTTLAKGKSLAFAFLSSIEARKKQLEALEEKLQVLKMNAEREIKNVEKRIDTIDGYLTQAKTDLKAAIEKKSDYLNKQITLFNERKQVLSNTKEAWSARVKILETHVNLVKEIIKTLEVDYERLRDEEWRKRLYYTWKEYKDVQAKIAEFSSKITSENTKKETLLKQKVAERERLTFLEKEIEAQSGEKTKLMQKEIEQKNNEREFLKWEAEIFEQKLSLLQEKVAHSNLVLEKLNYEIKHKEDEIQLLQYKKNEFEKKLPIIEKKLVLNDADVEVAKEEWKSEIQRSLLAKDHINKQR
jgi:chromosome segregation ATPase